jgi:glutamine amidotransferase-like uncharacterized protein
LLPVLIIHFKKSGYETFREFNEYRESEVTARTVSTGNTCLTGIHTQYVPYYTGR